MPAKTTEKPLRQFDIIFMRVAGRNDDGEARASALAQAFLSDLGLQNIIAGRTRKDTATATPHPKGPFVRLETRAGPISPNIGHFKLLKSSDGTNWEAVENGEFTVFEPADQEIHKGCFEVHGSGVSYPAMEFIIKEASAQPVASPPPPVAAKKEPIEEGAVQVARVKVSEIMRFEGQPREEFDDPSAMGGSLKQVGQLELITVTALDGVPGKKWKLVNGERRYRGAIQSGAEYLNAIVSGPLSDRDRRWRSYVTNFGHRRHTPYESAKYLIQLEADGRTVVEMATAVSEDRAWVLNHLALKTLALDLLEQMRLTVPEAKRLRFAVARMLAEVPQHEKQRDIWTRALRLGKPRQMERFVQKEVAALVPNGRAKRAINKGPKHQYRAVKRSLNRALTDMSVIKEVQPQALYLLLRDGKPAQQVIAEIRELAKVYEALATQLESGDKPKP